MSSSDEKIVFFARQDVTQHGHQDLDEAKICTFFFCISASTPEILGQAVSCQVFVLKDIWSLHHCTPESRMVNWDWLCIACKSVITVLQISSRKIPSNISGWHAILVLLLRHTFLKECRSLNMQNSVFTESYAMNNMFTQKLKRDLHN